MPRFPHIATYMVLLAMVALAGCAGISAYNPPPGAVNPLDHSRSLIASDAAVLSDEDIARILTTRVEVPQEMRIAVLYLAHESEMSQWRDRGIEAYRDAMSPVQKLRESDRVFDVSFLPSFLLPNEKSVPLIREAAARYQADWVLIVKTTARQFWKTRVIGKDEARARCEAECAVLDVRTGTIPYTSVAWGESESRKADEDLSLYETSLRVESEAVKLAMAENVAGLLAFLDGLGEAGEARVSNRSNPIGARADTRICCRRVDMGAGHKKHVRRLVLQSTWTCGYHCCRGSARWYAGVPEATDVLPARHILLGAHR